MHHRSASTTRRALLGTTAAATASGLLAPLAALAQGSAGVWPARPVSLVVGYPPGGLTDVGARAVSRSLAQSLGQPFTVENKPGASGNIAAAEVHRAAPDGYRLLVANTSLTINPHTYDSPSPNPNDFTPIGLILESQLVLCVHPSSPAKDLAGFVAWVRQGAASGGFSYASAGSGGNTHLAMEYLRERAGLPAMTQIPYKGSAPAIQDLVGNQVPCLIDAASLLLPFIQSGKLRPILVTGATRLPALPQVPTAQERGLKHFDVTVFVGLWGPPRLPADIARRTNAALVTALADPAVAGPITKNGDLVGGGGPERLAALTRDSYQLWGDIARRNGIKAG